MRNSGESDFSVFESLTGDRVSTLEGLSRSPEVILWLEEAAFSSQGTRLALCVLEEPRPVSTEAASVQGGEWTDPASSIELYDVESGKHWGTYLKQPFWDILNLAYSTEGEYLVIKMFDGIQAWHVAGELALPVNCPGGSGISFSPAAEIAVLKCVEYPKDEEPCHLVWDAAHGEYYG